MEPEKTTCPLCQEGDVYRTEVSPRHYRYVGRTCGTFCISLDDQEKYLGDHAKRETSRAKHISVLLRERHFQREAPPIPFLQFGSGVYPELEKAYSVCVTELLTRWPNKFSDRVDRCFCHLIRATPGGNRPGDKVQIDQTPGNDLLIFAERSEVDFFIDTMITNDWVTKIKEDERQPGNFTIRVTSTGWDYFDKPDRRQGDGKSPVFVAMSFGAPDHKPEMTALYQNAIRPAIHAAGYRAQRSDTDDYNDAVMDKVIERIRKAPFVVADLTDSRNGVYYEAGFASGCGVDVIYCCPSDTPPHFDITGLYRVEYDDGADLKMKLEERIVRSMSRGPHSPDEAEAAETT